MAGHPSRWRPETRETADHSIPFVVACALHFGSVVPAHFEDETMRAPELIDLMQKIAVEEDPRVRGGVAGRHPQHRASGDGGRPPAHGQRAVSPRPRAPPGQRCRHRGQIPRLDRGLLSNRGSPRRSRRYGAWTRRPTFGR